MSNFLLLVTFLVRLGGRGAGRTRRPTTGSLLISTLQANRNRAMLENEVGSVYPLVSAGG